MTNHVRSRKRGRVTLVLVALVASLLGIIASPAPADANGHADSFVVHSENYTAGFYINAADEKQWLSTECRQQLEAAGASFALTSWSEFGSLPRAAAPAPCDELVSMLGSSVRALVHSDAYPAGWVSDGTNRWFTTTDCRDALEAGGATYDVVAWSEIVALPIAPGAKNGGPTCAELGADLGVSLVMMRASGMLVTVENLGGVTVHALTAPEAVFANSTYLIETPNSLVAIDTQFLLPNAADMRAYAAEIGKPIDRVFITHEHPDHFLGSEAFADLPIYALQEVADKIAANGQAEIDEKQADFGPQLIASTFVTPQAVAPGTISIDGVTFLLEVIVDAEAETQLVIRLPDYGVVAVGDIVYSGVHLILAGQVPTWTVALQTLAATADDYPHVLPGHGVPTDPSAYAANIAWLAKAGELIGTAESAEAFKQGLIDAFPELGMTAAIDFVTPFLFPAN